ncbi:MAG TPA: SPOR domain-containing protein [Gammaproteobacteria bacterium]|nr:SPOR domain-containing protein [Gammaproteobacteria bacterium]
MKWIIYLLLLANISFFAWHYQSMGREQRRTQAERQDELNGAVRLVLLKEAETESGFEMADKVGLPQCRSLGPFERRNKAEEIKKLLQQQGLSLSLRISNEARRKAYWVYLAPLASHAAARKIAQKLKKDHRIKDIFIVGTGDIKDGISLGVFSKFELAYRRQSEIQKLGFDARLKDVKLPAKEYWLDWPQQSAVELSARQKEIIEEIGDSIRIIDTDCHV